MDVAVIVHHLQSRSWMYAVYIQCSYIECISFYLCMPYIFLLLVFLPSCPSVNFSLSVVISFLFVCVGRGVPFPLSSCGVSSDGSSPWPVRISLSSTDGVSFLI